MKIVILNGPNLNLLGQRDPEKYGHFSLSEIEKLLTNEFPLHQFTFYQSNIEGELINQIQSAGNMYDGLIINPGGYAHTSVAIRDALESCHLPKIEVHLSHLGQRESYRQNMITASVCDGLVTGFKEKSYLTAIYALEKIFNIKR